MTAARFSFIALLALLAGLLWSCSSKDKVSGPEPQPPVAPTALWSPGADRTTVTLRWSYSAVNIQGFRVYMSEDTSVAGSFALADSIATPSTHTTVIDSLTPGVHYYFYVTAYNADGESERSNRIMAATVSVNPPYAPNVVSASVLPGDTVVLRWTAVGQPDFFVVQRHDSGVAAWTTLDSAVAGNVTIYRDVAVTPGTHYYYRIGAKNDAGIAWSADSLSADVPEIGAPYAPAGLQAFVHLETQSVDLSWTNQSADADSIVVGRSTAGALMTTIATLPGTATSYSDTSLHQQWNLYSYRVQAVSIAHGASPWSEPVEVSYRMCSSGVIPLCLANYWVYAVDTVGGTDYSETRRVVGALFHGGQDFYSLTRTRNGSTDTLYYLHNDSTARGCQILHWPYDPSAQPQLLFKYPTFLLDYFYLDGDSVAVTQVSGTKQVGETVYTNVYIYERYMAANHWIKYYVQPNEVGVIVEEEYTGSHGQPDKRVTRTLTSSQILN